MGNKRLAYIGLSYPLFYDYKNSAPHVQNDLQSSPNAIIESPLGLMILYDELWFLCESLCPNNMRKLPYVKFVDQEFDNFYLNGATCYIENNRDSLINKNGFDFDIWSNKMNLINFGRIDNHTHLLKICDVERSANCASIDNVIFDAYVLNALQERLGDSIEMVFNSIYSLTEGYKIDNSASIVENILIPDIPNYLSAKGPYHESIDELRDHKNLKDFRKWIINNHENLQNKEIEEVKNEVNNTIQMTKEKVFKKHINNNLFRYAATSSKTIIITGLGCVCSPISILDAIVGIAKGANDLSEVKNDRWQGFVNDAQKIVENN